MVYKLNTEAKRRFASIAPQRKRSIASYQIDSEIEILASKKNKDMRLNMRIAQNIPTIFLRK